jgi:NADH:ubiquinone reductase (H+-translocating)
MKPHVIVVGSGFGGLELVKGLANTDCRVTLVDRANHHTFQPLLYQVAIAGLSPAEIAMPIRSIFSEQENCTVLLGTIDTIDVDARTVNIAKTSSADALELKYDHLVLAVGAQSSYFGKPEWEAFAPGLKSVSDALEVRNRVLRAFEEAERIFDTEERRAHLTFVVIGAGPTGVELAGAIAELARFTLGRDFRSIKPGSARVVLIEAGARVLGTFSTETSERAREQLAELGVEVRSNTRVTDMTRSSVTLADGETIDTHAMVWAAGVRGATLLEHLPFERDKQGRIVVNEQCRARLPDGEHVNDNVFVIGDAAHAEQDGAALPGVSPVAMQQGRYLARLLAATFLGEPFERAFRYTDKGSMATIGRARAVAEAKNIRLSGFIAWLAWLFIHVFYLIGFRNRFVVLFTWAWSYLSYRRGARLITQ